MSMLGVLRGPRQVLFGAGQRHALGTVTAALGSRALVVHRRPLRGHPRVRRAGRAARGRRACGSPRSPRCCPTSRCTRCASAPSSRPRRPRRRRRHGRRQLPRPRQGGGACSSRTAAQPSDYYGEFRVPGPVMPVVALPTTAGTGSEVTPVAVLTDPERVSKVGISSPHLIPHTADLRPRAHRSAARRPSPPAPAPTPSRTWSRPSRPCVAPVDDRARHRARLRRQERADRHLRPPGCPADRRQPAARLVDTRRHGGPRGDDARSHRRRLRPRHGRHGRGPRHPVPGRRAHPHPARGRGRRPAALRHGVQPTRRGSPSWPPIAVAMGASPDALARGPGRRGDRPRRRPAGIGGHPRPPSPSSGCPPTGCAGPPSRRWAPSGWSPTTRARSTSTPSSRSCAPPTPATGPPCATPAPTSLVGPDLDGGCPMTVTGPRRAPGRSTTIEVPTDLLVAGDWRPGRRAAAASTSPTRRRDGPRLGRRRRPRRRRGGRRRRGRRGRRLGRHRSPRPRRPADAGLRADARAERGAGPAHLPREREVPGRRRGPRWPTPPSSSAGTPRRACGCAVRSATPRAAPTGCW